MEELLLRMDLHWAKTTTILSKSGRSDQMRDKTKNWVTWDIQYNRSNGRREREE